jgi:hypothetical protein
MARKVLISLVSEQTLPNLELIKEFQGFINDYLFVHSTKTIRETNWIIQATEIKHPVLMEVNPFDIANIESKLKNFNFPDDEYYLNLTGGTKIMILVFHEFFKNLGAKIYYVTGQNCEYLKIFPAIGERNFLFQTNITLEEYLRVYGFDIKKSMPLKSFDQSKNILTFFVKNNMKDYLPVLEKIRMKRGKVLLYEADEQLKRYITAVGFLPNELGKLDKNETKYLSGEWFEEYVYYKIKEELGLNDDEIGTGYNLTKENTPNEIDVLFVFKHKLFIIECKTSVIETRQMPDGTVKDFKLLPEIIYKSDALRNKFGLFSNTSIFTLEEIKNEDGTPIKNYKTYFDRAELSRIHIVSKKEIKSGKSLYALLNDK